MKHFLIKLNCEAGNDAFHELWLLKAKDEEDAFKFWKSVMEHDPDNEYSIYSEDAFTTPSENVIEFMWAREVSEDLFTQLKQHIHLIWR